MPTDHTGFPTAHVLHAGRGGPHLGTAYYNEHHPGPENLTEDLSLMVAAGNRATASSTSSDCPQSSAPPAYVIPPWLSRKHPGLTIVGKDGSCVL